MIQFLLSIAMLLVTVGVCAVVAIIGAVMVARNKRVVEDGVRMLATVVRVRPISVDNAWVYEPTVQYTMHGQLVESVPWQGRLALRNGRFLGAGSNRAGEKYVGTQIAVVVDPRDPRISAVPQTSRLGILLTVVGIVFGCLILLFGLIGFVAGYMR